MAKGDPIRIVPHAGVDQYCGSFEVRFADGRKSQYFFWDDIAGRRLRHDAMDHEQAKEAAKAFAREERGKL